MMGRKGTFTDYVQRRWVSGGLLAIAAVARAVKAGKLPSAKDFSCVDCAKPAVEYDHRDYNFPLKVEPVCRRCNILRGSAVPKQWESREAADEIERLRAQLESQKNEWLSWAAKRDALELDAARYRWLRDVSTWQIETDDTADESATYQWPADDLDAAIDAAMKG